MAIWRRLLTQATRQPLSRALASAGRSNAARMAMMAMTTSNSIKVNAVVLAARGLRPVPAPTWRKLIPLNAFPRVTLK
jgi:hypothetical protein